ncbi:hypothetical protein [Tardiphaga sp. 841_E9_N1_2]|uniref:hypothetical protein n=1 Tax=Tardiphaga sp. 841_E9_N1_2 TaxID=3240762 RepID=UPI003F286B49
MIPDVVTFWEGPLDALRRLCLRSQVEAGHRVTLYSFAPITDLPDGVSNADAEAVLPRAFAERLRPSAPDGAWVGWTPLQFSDFFRIRLMAEGLGLWLDADVLLLKPIEIDSAKPYFAWEKRRQLGNSVLYLPPDDPIVAAFEALIRQDELTPDWMSLRHRLAFAWRKGRDRSKRASDVRVAIFGPASLTALAKRHGSQHHALPRKSYYAIHAEPKLFFEPSNFKALLDDPGILGFHISPKGRGKEAPMPGSFYAWATERVGAR